GCDSESSYASCARAVSGAAVTAVARAAARRKGLTGHLRPEATSSRIRLTAPFGGRYRPRASRPSMMRRTLTPLEPVRGWRRVAAQAWRPPRDPSVYAVLDIPMRSALAHLERLREETGVRVTVTHLVARGVALAIRQYPQLNGIVSRGRIMLRDTVDI